MDSLLSSFEKDVHPANNTETDWSDHFLSHNLCSEAVENYTSMVSCLPFGEVISPFGGACLVFKISTFCYFGLDFFNNSH